MKHAFFVLAWALASAPAFAAPDTVLLVFNGNTEANRHAYNFIGQVLGQANTRVQATLDPSKVKPGQYKAVVVVSTKATVGIDPVLAAFVAAYPAPRELYLVSLLSRTRSLAVTPFTAAASPLKVDGVTAATTWGPGTQEMHDQWAQVLADALEAR